MKKLGAIGTLVWDTNRHPSVLTEEGGAFEQWGGAVYSLSAFSAACPRGWVVEPIVRIGSDLEREATSVLSRLPNLLLGKGVKRAPSPNNRVELRYLNGAERQEILSGGVPPWSWAEIRPVILGLDALYVNFISGYELKLAAMRSVRDRFPGPIYGDLHSLFLGPAENGPRAPRPLPMWEEWLRCFDIVQLNDAELDLLLGARGELPHLLDHGPRLLVVTRGADGVQLVARIETFRRPLLRRVPASGPVNTVTLPAPSGAFSGDPTGCGDVWGAAFFAGLLDGLEVEQAADRAQRLAAVKITNPSTRHLRSALAASLGS